MAPLETNGLRLSNIFIHENQQNNIKLSTPSRLLGRDGSQRDGLSEI